MNGRIDRRKFLKSSSAAGLTVLPTARAFGAGRNSAVRIGVVGCGNRGIHVGRSFMDTTDAVVTAAADIFEDRLDEGMARFNEKLAETGGPSIPAKNAFRGPDACRRLAESSDVDAVLIATPHFIHPDQLDIVVDAGKHAYLEKPVAVDVHGCRRIMTAGERAGKDLSIAVGFQIRHATPFVEMVRRIHRGDIGDIVMGQTFYLAAGPQRTAPSWNSHDEMRLRLWALDRALSGDNILLQGVHVLDICNWVLDSHPASATGVCGRKGRHEWGNNRSHFLVTFDYPGEVPVAFQSQQFDPGYGDVCERFFGTEGISESHYTGGVFITGANEWDSGVTRGAPGQISAEDWNAGNFTSALDDADPQKEKAFIDSITSGRFVNEAHSGAVSTLTAILGSVAAYRREEITWDELLASDERVDPMIDLSKL